MGVLMSCYLFDPGFERNAWITINVIPSIIFYILSQLQLESAAPALFADSTFRFALSLVTAAWIALVTVANDMRYRRLLAHIDDARCEAASATKAKAEVLAKMVRLPCDSLIQALAVMYCSRPRFERRCMCVFSCAARVLS